jgi:translocation and assembly module TamB
MARRRVVVLASALVLFTLGALIVVAVIAITRTSYGRDRIRDFVIAQLAPKTKGKLYIGHVVGGSLFSGVAIDSVEIRGADDSLFIATGRIVADYDLRDLFDQRVLVHSLTIEHPVIRMAQDSLGFWNFKKIWPSGPPQAPKAARGWGDYIVIDTATVRNATFVLTLPWTPADSLKGARRDSAIKANLSRDDAEIRRAANGFMHTWRWTKAYLATSRVRISEPDSAGRFFQIRRLDVDESQPPFPFKRINGTLAWLGDSIWVDFKHFDLPASTGSGKGKIWWGSDLPMRYDVRIVGDSVSMRDVNWVYPQLPLTGGGKMVLGIRSERDPHITDYVLTEMDVNSTASRVRGNMTFGVGGPVLIVKDVALQGSPFDFELIKTLNGKPFPYDWRGTITGTVRGKGGPVNRFVLDDANVVFQDANVPGAVTRAVGHGELDILFPAFTAFHHFSVDVEQLDLRTPRFVNKNFPELNGFVSGHVVLDSSWLDVRFTDADLTHRDGPGEPSRVTGRGRLTLGDQFVSYDAALDAQPLSFTTLARSYPKVPLRGPYRGPLRLQGNIGDLALSGELTGAGGTFSVDGQFDFFPPGFKAQANLTLLKLDARTLLDTNTVPMTSLNGRIRADVAGDSLGNATGTVGIELDRSLVDSVRMYPSMARLSFGDQKVRVDTLHVETTAATIVASGALGAVRGVTDSLAVLVTLDSLGGLRRYLGLKPDTTVALDGEGSVADSLPGTARIAGHLRGSVDSLGADGTIEAHKLWMRGDRVSRVGGEFALRDLTHTHTGTASVHLDTLVISGVALAQATAAVEMRDSTSGIFVASITSMNASRVLVRGDATIGTDTSLVRFDTTTISAGSNRWHLVRPALLTLARGGAALDTMQLVGSQGGQLTLAGTLPKDDPVHFMFRADSLPLDDVGTLVQSSVAYRGRARFSLDVTGTRAAPEMQLATEMRNAQFGDVHVDRVTGTGTYRNRRLDATAELVRGGTPVITAQASLPLDLSLQTVRRRLLDDTLHATIRSDSADFGIIEALSPSFRKAGGKFYANLDIGGTWSHETISGGLGIVNGTVSPVMVGDSIFGINADLRFAGDRLRVNHLSMRTRDERDGRLEVDSSSWVDFKTPKNPSFDVTVRATDFHAINQPRLAHLDISADLTLTGSYSGSALTGSVTVQRGSIFIPDSPSKRVISLDDPELFNIVDTTVFANRSILPKAPPELLRAMEIQAQIVMGSDIWLRSSEANIKLGGAVDLRRTVQRGQPQLALNGFLSTERGTYRVNLGVVQRTFTVAGGTITFYDDPNFNPTLNIRAVNTVRQFSGSQIAAEALRVGVQIGGTLTQPKLVLSSADSLQISQTDLVSYLITGAPNFDFGSGAAANALLGTASSFFSDRLRNSWGGIDLFDIQLGRYDTQRGQSGGIGGIFQQARLGVGKQFGDRTFMTLNTSLCRVSSLLGAGNTSTGGGGLPIDPKDIGVKVEHQLNLKANLSISASIDPPSSAQCTSSSTRGFVPTPLQYGLDLFRTWRF